MYNFFIHKEKINSSETLLNDPIFQEKKSTFSRGRLYPIYDWIFLWWWILDSLGTSYLILYSLQILSGYNMETDRDKLWWNQNYPAKIPGFFLFMECLVSCLCVLESIWFVGMYLQPHYGNGVYGNVYLSVGQH